VKLPLVNTFWPVLFEFLVETLHDICCQTDFFSFIDVT